MSDNVNVSLPGVNGQFVRLWDLNDASGIAELQVRSITAAEMIGRASSRYVLALSAGQTPGPKSGLNRIIIDARHTND